MAPEMTSENEIQEAPEETAPSTNVATAAEPSNQKPATISWFQRWKMERQKRAVVDAELRRIEQEKEEAAQRLASEKNAEEQKRSDEKAAEELRKNQEAERLKAEAKKAKAAAAKKPSAEKTPPPVTSPANGGDIYSPVGR
jgi:hypothetical protein